MTRFGADAPALQTHAKGASELLGSGKAMGFGSARTPAPACRNARHKALPDGNNPTTTP